MSDIDLQNTLDQMARDLEHLIKSLKQDDSTVHSDLHIVGIRTGGVWVASEIAKRLHYAGDIGELNISFYRDDFTQIGLHPQVTPSSLPFSVEEAHIILIDDVLMSGRTVRAAMNELFDYGRPASISLAVLVDLKQKQLPISAQVVGAQINLSPHQRIKLKGPDDLTLEIQELSPDR